VLTFARLFLITRRKLSGYRARLESCAYICSFISDDEEVAKQLQNEVRILCWVMTSPDNLDKKAVHVRKTWAHR